MPRPRRRLADRKNPEGGYADQTDAIWDDMLLHPEVWLAQAQSLQRTHLRRHYYYTDHGPLGGLTRLAMREQGNRLPDVDEHTGLHAPNQTSSIDVFDQGCRDNIWFWISGGLATAPADYPYRDYLKPCVFTLDQHADEDEKIVRPFPWDKEYVRAAMDLMLANPLTVIEKSRKVMATWMAVVRFLWMAQFWPGREVIFQCKIKTGRARVTLTA